MTSAASGFVARLKSGLQRSAQRLAEGIAAIVTKRKLDDATLHELEELLIAADLGVELARSLTERLRRTRFNQEVSAEEIRAAFLAEEVTEVSEAGGASAASSTPPPSPS